MVTAWLGPCRNGFQMNIRMGRNYGSGKLPKTRERVSLELLVGKSFHSCSKSVQSTLSFSALLPREDVLLSHPILNRLCLFCLLQNFAKEFVISDHKELDADYIKSELKKAGGANYDAQTE